MKHTYVLIMAGGSGTRFWPRSRENRPKHLLSVYGPDTLIQSTVNRFLEIASPENIFIISKEVQREEILKQNLKIPPRNMIFEPEGKNTLPAIGLGLLYIRERDPQAVVVVSPADHMVENLSLFRDSLSAACTIANEYDAIVTVGIKPTFPSTGYGYISTDTGLLSPSGVKAYKINKFIEKPDIRTATQFCATEKYFWNSGLFIFKYSVMWDEIEEHAPDVYKALENIGKLLSSSEGSGKVAGIYSEIPGISIDYAIMEKSLNTFMIKGEFIWKDLGSWQQIYEISEKDDLNNATVGEVIVEDTRDSYIYSNSGLIALIGVKDLLVVQDGNATLICNNDSAEDVKKLVTQLKSLNLRKYT
jgi:mannose-1-phosphate guanylyltransferase